MCIKQRLKNLKMCWKHKKKKNWTSEKKLVNHLCTPCARLTRHDLEREKKILRNILSHVIMFMV